MGTWKSKRDIEHLARPPSKSETEAAERTHRIVRDAVAQEELYRRRTLDIFLQGSYANSTNISGSSDVDIVSCLEETYGWGFFSGVSEVTKRVINTGGEPANYSWSQYREDLLAALRSQFPGRVYDGQKAITVKGTPSGSSLDADVLPAINFRLYRDDASFEEGICFWRQGSAGDRIVNFPKQHRQNMSAKNAAGRAGPKFKGIIRAAKRLRDEVDPTGQGLCKHAASYWIECLFANVPDDRFAGSYNDAMLSALAYLFGEFEKGSPENMLQANGIYLLFHPTFWNIESAKALVNGVWDTAYEHVP